MNTLRKIVIMKPNLPEPSTTVLLPENQPRKTMPHRYFANASSLPDFGWLASFLIVFAVSALGGLARYTHENPKGRLKWRDALRYVLMAVLAGLIIGALCIYYIGPSILLIAVCGAAGFGSVQILTLSIELARGFIERFRAPLPPRETDDERSS